MVLPDNLSPDNPMVSPDNLTISKLDAAKRQLETVIRVYFSNGDPVSIHTLTAAAYNVLRDINKRRGEEPMLVKGQVLKYIKPEFQKELADKLNKPENFLKHADRDHDATLDFSPAVTEVMIFDACIHYAMLTKEEPPLFAVYRWWFVANHLDLFNLPEGEGLPPAINFPALIRMGRVSYFNVVFSLALLGGSLRHRADGRQSSR